MDTTHATLPDDQSLWAQALSYMSQEYDRTETTRLFHNDLLAYEQLDLARQALAAHTLPAEAESVVGLIAVFRPLAYGPDNQQAISATRHMLEQFLRQVAPDQLPLLPLANDYLTELATKPSAQHALAVQLLHDTWTISHYSIEYPERSGLRRIEAENREGRSIERDVWDRLQLRELTQARLRTTWARTHYGQELARNLLWQRTRLDKRSQQSEAILPLPAGATEGLYQGMELDVPLRGAQTYFRTTYRVHINLSAIADNKANIMISVNAILISVLITFLSYRNIAETNPSVLLPVVIFLVTGLASLTFAILSARPKVTQLNETPADRPPAQNLFFFGNFVNLPLPEYESALDTILHDEALLYGNMSRDLYHLGQVLAVKYRYLTTSYNIFMVGFAATVVTFLVTLFFF